MYRLALDIPFFGAKRVINIGGIGRTIAQFVADTTGHHLSGALSKGLVRDHAVSK